MWRWIGIGAAVIAVVGVTKTYLDTREALRETPSTAAPKAPALPLEVEETASASARAPTSAVPPASNPDFVVTIANAEPSSSASPPVSPADSGASAAAESAVDAGDASQATQGAQKDAGNQEQEIAAEINRVPITAYVTSTCNVCARARAFMSQKGINYSPRDIEVDHSAASTLKRLNASMSVPTFDIDGTIVVGFDEQSLMQSIRQVAARRVARANAY